MARRRRESVALDRSPCTPLSRGLSLPRLGSGRVFSKCVAAGQYVMLERSEASLPGWALRLFASLKSRTMSVATGTLEDETYQAAVTPSGAEGSKALCPQSSCA